MYDLEINKAHDITQWTSPNVDTRCNADWTVRDKRLPTKLMCTNRNTDISYIAFIPLQHHGEGIITNIGIMLVLSKELEGKLKDFNDCQCVSTDTEVDGLHVCVGIYSWQRAPLIEPSNTLD